MKQSLQITARTLTVLILSFMSLISYAADLSQSNIDAYIKSINLVKASDNPIIEGIKNKLESGEELAFNFDVDENGNIALVSQMMKNLDAKQLSVLGDMVEDGGFSSVDEFSSVGDKISAAMMAIEMEKSGDEMDMEGLTPEMMQMMPAEMREQMEGVMRMMKAAKNVPKGDIDMVKVNYSKLEQAMDDE